MPRRIVLGVGGGIAAYKACLLLRLFTEAGHDVRVVPTEAALTFVGAPTWAALSGHPVSSSVWDAVDEVPHVRIGREADLVVVAPATADLLARAAHGLAPDLLTNVLLTARCPVMMAPAMHTEMWMHPATVANVATLRARGVHVVEPASGRLTGADTGPGRLPEPAQLFAAALDLLDPLSTSAQPVDQQSVDRQSVDRQPVGPLSGRHVLISVGGTREPLDPVRFLGNRSSGRQGMALARAALQRGAEVTLVVGAVEVPAPEAAKVVRVETALQMREAMTGCATEADVVVMAAAVADFRPQEVAGHKIKKRDGSDDAPVLTLVRNPDILAGLVAGRRPGQIVVGFAAETGDESGSVLDHALAKLARKGCDLLVLNDVSAGRVFGRDETEITVLSAGGGLTPVPPGDKEQVSAAVWDAVEALLER